MKKIVFFYLLKVVLSVTDHISNRIRLSAAAMFKLDETGYHENLTAMTIIRLDKTFGTIERITAFENAVIKKSLKFSTFHL